ncbi:MAG: IPT/TIG domain-containing protein [Treponema sp.]|jgi:transglutaminase-like putative cysteine protease|nr:IPT/TIG domain-containing protein [Treponema sp.]
MRTAFRYSRRNTRPPYIFLLPLFFAPFFLCSCGKKPPVIHSVNPRIGTPGDVLTISGEYFGGERNESYVTIAGTAPTGSSYIAWRDDAVSLRIPESGDSGLVYVHVRGRKSNGVLFSNQAVMPKPVQGSGASAGPRIVSVHPQSGAPGSLLTISGSGFGGSREDGGVYFTWDGESGPRPEERQTEMVEVSEPDFGYEYWSDQEIRVRVPDGAASGNIQVKTARQLSRPLYFEVSGNTGTKTYRDKRSYTISYSVDIQVDEANNPNTLYLWVPRPVRSASQRGVELLSRSGEPFMENHRGTDLFRFSDLTPKTGITVTHEYRVDVYAQETGVRHEAVRQDRESPVTAQYTLPSPLVPSGNAAVKARAAAITGRERNPYLNARAIYNWITREIKTGTAVRRSVPEALESGTADPYTAALLFCSLGRAAGIPSLPVAGILVNRNRLAARHYWAEFWIDGIGWIPVDPALGSGAAPGGFNLRSDHASWYFGNLDNQRIAFSRAETVLSPMAPRSRTSARTRDYALQNLWEEAAGGLESYSSFWGDITITGIYAQ